MAGELQLTAAVKRWLCKSNTKNNTGTAKAEKAVVWSTGVNDDLGHHYQADRRLVRGILSS